MVPKEKRHDMTKLTIEGMTCGHCKRAVEEALQAVPGVASTQVDLDQGSARVEGGEVTALLAAVSEAGYTAQVTE